MEACEILTENFKEISIYGSKIFIRSFEPQKTQQKLNEILKNAGVKQFEITPIPVPLQ